MKNAVWKFELHPDTPIKLPKDAKVLKIGTQYGSPILWALVDTDELLEERIFTVVGTGWVVSDLETAKYHGTFMLEDGALVFHVFER